MRQTSYPDSFLNRLDTLGSTSITPEDSDKYWVEHKAGMTWGIQKALSECSYPRDVAILGAGKCNDIRLLEVMERGSVENVDLYDLDADSIYGAIQCVKAKINKFLPEAINCANFNPVIADVTFVLQDLLRRFDRIRGSFMSNMAPIGTKRKWRVYRAIIDAINESIKSRQFPDIKYDVVVSDCILNQIILGVDMQINTLIRDLFSPSERDFTMLADLQETVHEIFAEDHIDVLKKMTRVGGSIFIASDRILLYRGKVSRNHEEMLRGMQARGELPEEEVIRDFGGDYLVEELEMPRCFYMDGDLLQILESHKKDLELIDSKDWEWNREPHELQKSGASFGAEKVQGVVLKKLK